MAQGELRPPRLPGFRFDLLEVHNERYRPDKALGPEEVRFPYDDDSFDMVCAFEVFMHISPDGVRNYLREVARLRRPGATAILTFMAIYPGEHEVRNAGRAFIRVSEGVYSRFPERTSTSMGYDLALIREMLVEAQLEEFDLLKGSWHDPYMEFTPLTHGCDLVAVRGP